MIAHPIETGQSYTALALNYYLPAFFSELWNRAKTRVCADGGANRVASYFSDREFKRPDLVVGDFDSLRPEIRESFSKAGSKFIKIFDQDYNDVEKSLYSIMKTGLKEPVIIFGAFGGRLDHTIASLHAALTRPELRIFFLDENNFSTWIRPEDKGILCPQKWTTKICGLLPIAQPVRKVKTTGLKWDCNFELRMDGMVSASNEIAAGCDRVSIETSDPVLWTNQTKKLKDLPIKSGR